MRHLITLLLAGLLSLFSACQGAVEQVPSPSRPATSSPGLTGVTSLAPNEPPVLPTRMPMPRPMLIWESDQEGWISNRGGCKSLRLGSDDRAQYGSCDSLQTFPFVSRQGDYFDRWPYLFARFAPFHYQETGQDLIFGGRGQETASPAWQRAIAALARVAELQLEMGRTSASWAVGLAWSEEIPSRPSHCMHLEVEFYGYAYAATSKCAGGDVQNLGREWLGDGEWEQFDAWYYGRVPMYQDFADNRLDLFSRGAQVMTQDEVARLREWVWAVYAQLAIGTPGADGTTTPAPHR